MLAYVFYHWKRNDIAARDYEQALRSFHQALKDAPPAGFERSWCVSLAGAPWANAGGDSFEDWYVVGDSSHLDALNDAAVTASRQVPHDKAASAAAGGTAGLYRLRTGNALSAPRYAAWFGKPADWSYSRLYDELERTMSGSTALWVRQMTLGPALEFCLHANEPIELPLGIAAQALRLRTVFPQGA
jgi:hypothetical protein